MVNERVTSQTYRVCGECGHVYDTEEALIHEEDQWRQRWNAQGDRWPPVDDAESILSCPLCAHDF